MWPLCLIASKFLRMDEDAGEGMEVIRGGGDRSLLMGDDGYEDDVKNWSACIISSNSRLHFVDVPHIRQLFNWDCGLACVLMVLRTLGITNYEVHDLEELCPTRSIWTIDLAYLLQKLLVTFSFFTVTIGANRDFRAETFYKEQLEDDLERVDTLFEKAREVGIIIQHRSISGKEISSLILSGNYIAVALVDKYKLSHSCLKEYIPGCYEEHFGYIGHYIVICGYDMNTNQYDIRDPASARKHEKISLKCLEEARKSFGTDEDILLISLNGASCKSRASL